MKITTALFDLDGVLVDSGPLVKGAFDHTFAAFGLSGARAKEFSVLSGLTLKEAYARVADGQRLTDMMQLTEPVACRFLCVIVPPSRRFFYSPNPYPAASLVCYCSRVNP